MLKSLLNLAAAAAFFAAAPALAQIEEIDPNRADEYQSGGYEADAAPETWQDETVARLAFLHPHTTDEIDLILELFGKVVAAGHRTRATVRLSERSHVFTIPVHGGPEAADELNRFLAAHRVIAIDRELIQPAGHGFVDFTLPYLREHLRAQAR